MMGLLPRCIRHGNNSDNSFIDEVADLLTVGSKARGVHMRQAVHLQRELVKAGRRDLANRVARR